VFAVFFTGYLVERSKQVDLFDLSQATLNKDFGAINTVFPLISSLFVVLAVRAMRAAQRLLAQRFIVAAFLCGVAFIVVKFFEYREKIAADEIPTTNKLLPAVLRAHGSAPVPPCHRLGGADRFVVLGVPATGVEEPVGVLRRRGLLLADGRPAMACAVPADLPGQVKPMTTLLPLLRTPATA
jgi:hypothetical protein